MEEKDFEELEMEVIEKLSWLEEMELTKVYEDDCQFGTPPPGGKRVLLKLILKFLTSEVTDLEDRGLSYFLKIKTTINGFEEAYLEKRERKSGILKAPVFEENILEYSAPREIQSGQFSKQTAHSRAATPPARMSSSNFMDRSMSFERENPKPDNEEIKKLKEFFRKEFKIQGTVGKPRQKDKLSFSSLAFQIDSAEKKGYPEDDIISAVIKAINPDLQLRSYLEGKTGMSLSMRVVHILLYVYQYVIG